MSPTKNIRNTKAIAKNTVFLYVRSIVVMAVGLFTSRVILQALGVNDYGVYNVVGGFVSMFSILSTAMVNASQRFISYEMGKVNPQMNRIFCGTVSIHLILAVILLLLFETFGIWFLNTQLNISSDRMYAANWVFQCSVLTFCVNLISVPYNASIIAHEKMNVFAYISIYEAFAKLGIVYLLYVTGYDKLIVYAVLMFAIAVSLRLLYGFYCSRHFEECKFHFEIDKPLLKELLSFTGWNFIGSTAGILSIQGINILVNVFFGVALNAARGIVEQANQAVNTFIGNFMTAMNPQITKSYAAGDYSYMRSLMVKGAKYSAVLYWFLALPIFVEAENILQVWLVEVPDYAILFLRLTIIYSVFRTLANTIYTGMIATGNIRNYQIVMGALYLCSFVLCFVFFKIGLGPEYSYISSIIIAIIQLFVRLKLISDIVPDFSKKEFFTEAILKSLFVVVSSVLLLFLIKSLMSFDNIYIEILAVLFISVVVASALSYWIAFSKKERTTVVGYANKLFRKVSSNH